MMEKSRADIKQLIDLRLSADSRIDSNNIKVKLSNSTATVSGVVHSVAAKDAVESDLWAIKEIHYVDNKLKVKFPDGYQRPADETIKENCDRLFAIDPDLYLEDIECTVNKGVISLSGSVGQYYRKKRAEFLANQVGGAQNVRNGLSVVPTREVEDQTIAKTISHHMEKVLGREENSVVIEVQKGHVVLAGTVPDRRSFDTVEDIARYTDGVVDVKNHMSISDGYD
ncbi:BON domain-containing protein [Chitinispirillales bacterium ANBcel5]|uniref:BON domain-containing protein n=1 Tax=Cellulosispirillum alkaliphilum TaxID=3039283 RepID=UPI002A4F29F6|nr:BON domain-containing protein [Chitinispirillales bacterium ANBcel5]